VSHAKTVSVISLGKQRHSAGCASGRVRLLLLAVLMCWPKEQLHAYDGSLPAEFYIVSLVTSDASPFWYHYILDVRPDGRDSVVRYIRVAPMDSMCANSITVKAATVRLPGVSPSDLVARSNPCTIDSPSLDRKIYRRTRTAAIDDSVRFTIVADCGSREVVLRLPYPEQVNLMDSGKRTRNSRAGGTCRAP
jgi:hypothetical protein